MDGRPPFLDGSAMRGTVEHQLRFDPVRTIVYGALFGFGFAGGAIVVLIAAYAGWRLGAP